MTVRVPPYLGFSAFAVGVAVDVTVVGAAVVGDDVVGPYVGDAGAQAESIVDNIVTQLTTNHSILCFILLPSFFQSY